MAGTTTNYSLPYPESTDLVASYPALGQDLAEDLDTILAAKPTKTSGTTAPSTPATGDIWYDTNSTPPAAKFYDGSAWQGFSNGLPLLGGWATISTTPTGSYTDADGDWDYWTATASGNLITVTDAGIVDVLIVGAGGGGCGGGGSNYGPGGGGGGVQRGLMLLSAATHHAYIAAGGAGGAGGGTPGTIGGPSHLGFGSNSLGHTGVGWTTPPVFPNIGGYSGNGYSGGTTNTGGGGGATAVGQNNGGAGGAGWTDAISSSSVEYGKGGAGAGSAAGAANTGTGGAGGVLNTAGGAGGSGLIIVRRPA